MKADAWKISDGTAFRAFYVDEATARRDADRLTGVTITPLFADPLASKLADALREVIASTTLGTYLKQSEREDRAQAAAMAALDEWDKRRSA